MNKPMYYVQIRKLHEDAVLPIGADKSFQFYGDALTHFHNLCTVNNIPTKSWIQSTFQMTANSPDHEAKILILDF